MPERVFVITKDDGETILIRASKFDTMNMGGGAWSLKFYEEGKSDYSAKVAVRVPYSVIPQDMLFESLADSLIYPTISPPREEGLDFLVDSLFSETDKKPFSLEERRLLVEVLQDSKKKIQETFNTTNDQQAEINQKLDYLTEKVTQLDKFNWKRLFISTLVGISVDLSFGTMVPTTLIAIFQEVMIHLIKKGHTMIKGNEKGLSKT